MGGQDEAVRIFDKAIGMLEKAIKKTGRKDLHDLLNQLMKYRDLLRKMM